MWEAGEAFSAITHLGLRTSGDRSSLLVLQASGLRFPHVLSPDIGSNTFLTQASMVMAGGLI